MAGPPDDRALFFNVQAAALRLRDSLEELFDFEPGELGTGKETEPDKEEVNELIDEVRALLERLATWQERR